MKIKKGDWFKCIESPNKKDIATGDYYQSETYDILKFHTDPKNSHVFRDDGWERFFIKLYTIQDLKDGKVAVENDGTVDELKKVLKEAFPRDYHTQGIDKFYFATYNSTINLNWNAAFATNIPAQSVKDFLAQLPKKEDVWEPKVGEMVEWRQNRSSSVWRQAEYLATDKESKEPYALVYTTTAGERAIFTSHEIRKIPKKIKVTKQEIADKMGIELNKLEIIN